MTGNKLHLLNTGGPFIAGLPEDSTVHHAMLSSRLSELDSFAYLAYFLKVAC